MSLPLLMRYRLTGGPTSKALPIGISVACYNHSGLAAPNLDRKCVREVKLIFTLVLHQQPVTVVVSGCVTTICTVEECVWVTAHYCECTAVNCTSTAGQRSLTAEQRFNVGAERTIVVRHSKEGEVGSGGVSR
eukprot:5120-Heterococcus_DN1.PRE.1